MYRIMSVFTFLLIMGGLATDYVQNNYYSIPDFVEKKVLHLLALFGLAITLIGDKIVK